MERLENRLICGFFALWELSVEFDEEIVGSLGAELEHKFITEFKNSLEKNYLLRIEEMGVNLHMIQLRQELLKKT